jgi:multiple sugar transport system substrate-binding protein
MAELRRGAQSRRTSGAVQDGGGMNKLGSRRWSALVIVAMIAAACTGTAASPSAEAPTAAPPSGSSAAPATDAPVEKPFEGETINVSTYSSVTDFDFYATIIPEFEALTGITVNYVQQPVAAMDQKIPLQLSAKDTSLDVFFTGSENIGSYIGIEGVEPLDAYLDDPAQTAADYDFDDIAPAVQAACQNGGQNWCIASKTGGAVLYYNTRMLEEAGITAPPQNPAELLDYAKRLTNDEQSGFCTRGDKTQNLYTAFMLWQWFYAYDNDVTGNYFDKEWNFLLSEDPSATEFATWYRDITQNASPDGIATYLVTNCLQDFQQGRVAMWHDDSGMIGEVLDPEKSRVSEETAFHALPCQPVNPDHCSLVQPFGIWMNRASEHKGASWQFMQWITSKSTQSQAASAGALLTPSRLSVLQDPAVIAAMPETFPEALTTVLGQPNVALLPFIPEGVAILPPMLNGLSELNGTDRPIADVMADMGAGVDAIMAEAGYPKPFPEQ